MQNGKVSITLDRPRSLKFDFNAWCAIEEVLGLSLMQVPNPLSLGLRGQRAMLYAGLVSDDPTLTIAQVGGFFDSCDKGMILKKITEAVTAANPEASKSPNAEWLGDGTGTSSTEQPAGSD